MTKGFTNYCSDIDFVVLWVDGSDPDWIEKFNHHTMNLDGDKRTNRYRDWDNLRYIFRAFEQCTPWVRKIHFVTYGHLPIWLNCNHEKLNVVRHEDFLSQDILPVFNCNPLEINLHRVPDIADRFVYFNDDMFLLKDINKEHYFVDGKPCDIMAFNAIYDSPIAHIKINDVSVINRNFDKFKVVQKNFFKLFNYKCGLEIFKTILLMPWPKMTGFYDPHQPQPFLKSVFNDVWDREVELLEKTTSTTVRSSADVNQYLFRYWQLCKGSFHPRSFRKSFNGRIESYDDIHLFCEKIRSRHYEEICINDCIEDDELFIQAKKMMNEALDEIFPHKSSFER